jgi:Ca2+-binding RTX toxin-like protein
MKIAMILGTMAACACLGAMSNGFAAGDEDILVAGKTTYDSIRYDPKINLLTIAGGSGDDRIEVELAKDGGVLLNGISLAKLGVHLERIPVLAVHGGGGNDILVSRGFPLAVMNGGDGKDILVWDNGDREFDRATLGDDVLLWNSPETEFAYGGAGLDVLIANTGGDRDVVFGNLGRDVLIGGSGVDRLGDDDVIGGWGNDWISGGTGQDGKDGGDLLSAGK